MEEERRKWLQREEEMRMQEEAQRLEIMRVERETLEAEARAAEERGLAKEEEARLAAAEAVRAAAQAQASQTIKEMEAAWAAQKKVCFAINTKFEFFAYFYSHFIFSFIKQ